MSLSQQVWVYIPWVISICPGRQISKIIWTWSTSCDGDQISKCSTVDSELIGVKWLNGYFCREKKKRENIYYIFKTLARILESGLTLVLDKSGLTLLWFYELIGGSIHSFRIF